MNTVTQRFGAVMPRAQEFGTGGLISWIQGNVVTLVLIALAVCVLWAARGGNISKGITIVAGSILGIMMLGLATGNSATEMGDWMVGLLQS